MDKAIKDAIQAFKNAGYETQKVDLKGRYNENGCYSATLQMEVLMTYDDEGRPLGKYCSGQV
jgi:hypothetical protein